MRTFVAIAFLVAGTLSAEIPSQSPTTETITLVCSLKACSDEYPASPFDEASCTDYELNTTLIESMAHDDRSATDLLRQRYATTFTYGERHRIAGALLGRVPDDREYWSELAAYGADAIRFPYVEGEPMPEYIEWCAARALDPDQYHWTALRAFELAALDRRGRGMVLQALESKDRTLVQGALAAILERRDESFLPAIEKALERFPDEARGMAMGLGMLQSDAADRVALKFVPEDGVEEYREQQRQAACETMAGCDP